MPISSLVVIASALFLSQGPASPAGSSEEAEATAVVAAAGLKTDGSSLLALFRKRTLTEKDRAKLEATIRLLGDDSFQVRNQASQDLATYGPVAVPYLRAALKDRDLEIVRRAERCLEALERGPGSYLPMAAAKLLGARKPPGTVKVLLAYLPFADDDAVTGAVLTALREAGFRAGKADLLLVSALRDRDGARRAGAAQVLAQSLQAEHRRAVEGLLADPALEVRFQAGRALVAAGDKAAVPPLIALLSEAPSELAWETEELLFTLAGGTGPASLLGDANTVNRRICRAAWESWWRSNEAKFDPSRIQPERRLLGQTLIADLDKGRIVEVGPDHRERWHVAGFVGPVDMQLLPNGHLLVAENHASRVTERDRTGRIVWEKKTPALPASCQRLPNGDTFIALYNHLLIVTAEGKETLSLAQPEGVYSAQKLRNGQIMLVTSTGRVVTLDGAGKFIRSFETGGVNGWSSIDVLSNGHCLACCLSNRVVEFDAAGRRVWECTVPNAVCATRLPNGHMLVCNSEGRQVVEVDRTGREVWMQRTEGRPWHVRRR
jgi:hypothetical protein